ncbi:YbgA family protein [Saccharospirillum mangrovi]|uniref:YbgA family protein n=1 Tax=Saccharospirillum mangrovi TaxID=2161747 RepID=UPI0018E54E3D|nr:DUF523 and DUF1722 domain-containing protein [Saccharospirillum mangrovi]
MNRLTLAVSSCLLGDSVRYNGGHKLHRWLTNTLGQYADFRPFCPEVGIGLGIPREPIRLIQTDTGTRAVNTTNAAVDHTEALQHYAQSILPQLDDIDGYVVMQGSPSCGMERVKLYNGHAIPEKNGVGIHTQTVLQHRPGLPVEESGRLSDAALAENFVQRLYVHNQWRTQQPWQSAKALIDFHSRQKYLLMMHDYNRYKSLGRLLADLSDRESLAELGQRYFIELMDALKKIPKRGQRVNVLQHLLGYFKQQLSDKEKASLRHSIEQYQNAIVPFIVPIALLKHYVFLHGDAFPYLVQQSVLDPYPESLGLRNPI